MAFFAPLFAALAPARVAVLAYLARYGLAVAWRAAPLAATVLLGLALYLAVGWPLKALVVGLAVAASALGFEVRGHLPAAK